MTEPSSLVWVRLTPVSDWQVAARDPDGDGWLVIGVPTPVHPAVVGDPVSLQRPREAFGGEPQQPRLPSYVAAHIRQSPVAIIPYLVEGGLGGDEADRRAIERDLGGPIADEVWAKACEMGAPWVARARSASMGHESDSNDVLGRLLDGYDRDQHGHDDDPDVRTFRDGPPVGRQSSARAADAVAQPWPRGALAQARRLWLHYQSLADDGRQADPATVARDIEPLVAALERACDEIDRLRGEQPAAAQNAEASPGAGFLDDVAQQMLDKGWPLERILAELVINATDLDRIKAAGRIHIRGLNGRRERLFGPGIPDANAVWLRAGVLAAMLAAIDRLPTERIAEEVQGVAAGFRRA